MILRYFSYVPRIFLTTKTTPIALREILAPWDERVRCWGGLILRLSMKRENRPPWQGCQINNWKIMHNVFPLVIISDSERYILIFSFNQWQDYSCGTLLFKLFFSNSKKFPDSRNKAKNIKIIMAKIKDEIRSFRSCIFSMDFFFRAYIERCPLSLKKGKKSIP